MQFEKMCYMNYTYKFGYYCLAGMPNILARVWSKLKTFSDSLVSLALEGKGLGCALAGAVILNLFQNLPPPKKKQ